MAKSTRRSVVQRVKSGGRSSSVAAMPVVDRPRERLQRSGRHSLTDLELMALVLGHGVSGRSALQRGAEILDWVGGIHGLARANLEILTSQDGVGIATAAQLLAAVELGRRTLERPPDEKVRLGGPRELALYLMPRYGAHPVERFGVVLVDSRHQLLHVRILSVGSLDAVAGNPREVFRDAIASNAAGIAVFHNHPSGDPSPSPDDLQLTHRLAAAGKMLGIELVDHVIIGDAKYFSMKEFGGLA